MKLGGQVSRIQIDPPRQEGKSVRLEGELKTAAGKVHRIYFEFSAPDDRPYALAVRPFLLALLLPAMQAGAPLELDLPVDAITLENLMEWQEAMVSWQPYQLKVIPIRAPRVAAPPQPFSADAITAFSGGIDSNFTVWRQVQNVAEPIFRKAPLRAGLMVHGFDIPLQQEAAFERAWKHSKATLEAAGLTPYRLKTNLREIGALPGCRWGPSSHGISLSAALACFEPWFSHLLIPSSYPYPKLILPLGSNPVTDPLMSSATATYWHDGAAHTKFAKIQFLASLPAVQEHLRVCWRAEPADGHCGKCFKCMATRLGFELCGVDRLGSFPTRYTPWQLAFTPIPTLSTDWEVRLMRREARRQGRHQMARGLSIALAYGKIIRLLIKLKLRQRHPAKKTLWAAE